VILRCTNKLLAVIGPALADPAPAPDADDWYANLLWFDRRKCLLATHAGTLFTIFEANVTASALRATRQLITGLISRELRREDLPPATFGILDEQGLLLAKTADRSVLPGPAYAAVLAQPPRPITASHDEAGRTSTVPA